MVKILPILLAIIGLGGGVGVGMMLKPPSEVVEVNPCGEAADPAKEHTEPSESGDAANGTTEFVKINNQFVIPVVQGTKIASLVVMSLNVEVKTGGREIVYQREPKLRDEFLQVMFNHANNGGFDGMFTQSGRLASLRMALKEVAVSIIGDTVRDVLVTNIVRQDI